MKNVALRYFNVYGVRQRFDAYGNVIPIFAEQMLRGRTVTIFGDGEQTRDFVHADDLAGAIIAALRAPAAGVAEAASGAGAPGGVYQVGTGRETTVNDLAATLAAVVGRPVEIRHLPVRAGDITRNSSRVDLARERLGWTAQVTLEDGLARTVAWFRDALADPALAGIAPDARSGSE
jgi:UDP-glucose 4-epimerase